jgi:hypothetical protein
MAKLQKVNLPLNQPKYEMAKKLWQIFLTSCLFGS